MASKKTNSYKILSVGGSIIIPPGGFDVQFLKKFKDVIVSRVKKGGKFILVVGGGATARFYQAGGRDLGFKNEGLDWIGIQTTVLNARFVQELFKEYADKQIVTDPTKKIKTNKKIIIAAGWKPGCSTDKDAVLLAKTYGAKEVLNLSNIDYVYDSDPKLNPGAKKIERANWKELRKIVGNTWSPGANVPFDPSAAKEGEKLCLTVKFVKGTDLTNVVKAIDGKLYPGTIIE